MPTAVASRYARPLADVVLDLSKGLDPQQILAELGRFEEAFTVSSDLRHVLLSPAVPPERKRAVVDRLAALLGLSRITRNFLCVVIDHRRAQLLSEMRSALQAVIDERTGVVEITVTSARRLSEDQQARIAAGLARLAGRRVRSRFATEEKLIAGITAQIGFTIYDGSVRGRLDGLRRKLME